MTDIHQHECRSWLGNNPLHVLAALGALALTEDEVAQNRARLSWKRDPRGWMPVVHAPLDPRAWCSALARRVREAGATQADPDEARAKARAVQDAKKAVKKAAEQLKTARGTAKGLAKDKGLKGAQAKRLVETETAELEGALSQLEATWVAAQEAVADELGHGPAHLGAVAGVDGGVFRKKAADALDRAAREPSRAAHVEVRQLAALASDACLVDGKVQPTPLSFGNGASGQEMLKDFRALSAFATEARVVSVMRGEPELVTATSLNWDPAGQRTYALQWSDPGTAGKADIDVVTHALAYMGLGLLTAVPTSAGVTTAGFANRSWTWPVWSRALTLPVVMSLLVSPRWVEARPSRHGLARMGVVEVMRSERLSINKRFFFAPAAAV